MMNDDIKKVTCVPEDEINVIQLFESFGYSLQHEDEIYNKDSVNSTEVWGDWIITGGHVEVTHYVKMLFRRNPKISNYQELVALEQEYESIKIPEKPVKWSIFEIMIGLCIFTVPGVLMILANMKTETQIHEWEKNIQELNRRKEEIVQKARELVV